jgi:hypothetical protein
LLEGLSLNDRDVVPGKKAKLTPGPLSVCGCESISLNAIDDTIAKT